MKLEMRGQMRLEQQMKLAPHMIQSMEILQLPILALQERIDQELNSNPVLEKAEPEQSEEMDTPKETSSQDSDTEIQIEDQPETFEQLDKLSNSYDDYLSQAGSFRRNSSDGETDRKLQAIKNTEALSQSLHEYLWDQWRFTEVSESVKKAGQAIIDYINDKGYLTVRLEQLYNKDKTDFAIEDLKKALKLVQNLEPAGVGARDLKECLLIQFAQSGENMEFEQTLVSKHMDKLLENRLPEIAKKMNCSIDQINKAIKHISKFDTSPGLLIGSQRNCTITADVIVEQNDESGGFTVRLAGSAMPELRISDYYVKMAKTSETNEKTRHFLQNNIRSAQWIMDAIEQRKNTLLKVTRSVVKHQKDFFLKGQAHLRPLPMAKVADDVGVHLATVSRAVAGKYVQCSQGMVPLRKFFSGGTEDDNGQAYSWEAIRVKLQKIIDTENKAKPLSDNQIRKKLAEIGINNIARRTVAKYRKLLNIPVARFRKKY